MANTNFKNDDKIRFEDLVNDTKYIMRIIKNGGGPVDTIITFDSDYPPKINDNEKVTFYKLSYNSNSVNDESDNGSIWPNSNNNNNNNSVSGGGKSRKSRKSKKSRKSRKSRK